MSGEPLIYGPRTTYMSICGSVIAMGDFCGEFCGGLVVRGYDTYGRGGYFCKLYHTRLDLYNSIGITTYPVEFIPVRCGACKEENK